MRILHVITGLSRAAGTSTFCGEVCNQLVARGHDVTIATCNPAASNIYPLDSRIRLVSIGEVVGESCRYDLIHIHALWSPILHKVAKWARQNHIPIVWSTHGMTAPWAMKHKWWKKWLPWWLYQKWDLMKATLIHCTSDFEVEWNQALGFKRCCIAPLGTSLPNLCSTPTPNTYTSTSKTLLFVGRIYPVKALVRLIEAFARVDESLRRNWTFRLVGPNQEGHMADLMALCDRLGLSYSTPIPHTYTSNSTSSEVEFVGPKFGQDLDNEYASCDCLALVSHTENFGATVVDAMAHGKPVITSTKTPWKIVADNKCGWWVDNEVESLSATLREVFGSDDLHAIGSRGRKLVEEHYSWSAVCDKMVRGYEELMNDRA